MKAWFTRVCSQFSNRRTFLKLLCDAILMALVCLLVFWVLPHDVIFLGLASVHTQFGAIAGHAAIAIAMLLLARSLLTVYGVQWHATTARQCLTVIVADLLAGVAYYLVTDVLLGSTYPFLLTVTLFALIDILTLFIRLGYKSLCDEYSLLRRNEGHLTAKERGKQSSDQ